MSETDDIVIKLEIDDDGDDDDEYSNQVELCNDLVYDEKNDIPTTSNLPNNAKRKHPENDSVVELKVGGKVFKINMNLSQWIETHKNDFLKQPSKGSPFPTTHSQPQPQPPLLAQSQNQPELQPQPRRRYNESNMTDFSTATPYDELSAEDKNLKAFFNSMLRATQSLPAFHQRRIKGDLVKALRNQGSNVCD
ncbi:uncharacterized protein [Eurosta solidaginis]|uniref:uncharacterized protein n=1 Tax=Eurosta solidaginis TaxID=178769 RepID=UPI003530E913